MQVTSSLIIWPSMVGKLVEEPFTRVHNTYMHITPTHTPPPPQATGFQSNYIYTNLFWFLRKFPESHLGFRLLSGQRLPLLMGPKAA